MTEQTEYSDKKITAERFRQIFEGETLATTSEKLGGISKSAIGYWKSGQSRPDLDTLIKICEVYDVSSDWLLAREGAPKQQERGIVAACEYTELEEETMRKLKNVRFKCELEHFLEDLNLERFLSALSKSSSGAYCTNFALEAIESLEEEDRQGKHYVVSQLTTLRDNLKNAVDMARLARLDVIETALRCADSMYGIEGRIDKGLEKLKQVDADLKKYNLL